MFFGRVPIFAGRMIVGGLADALEPPNSFGPYR